jgi:hypothetical protein
LNYYVLSYIRHNIVFGIEFIFQQNIQINWKTNVNVLLNVIHVPMNLHVYADLINFLRISCGPIHSEAGKYIHIYR